MEETTKKIVIDLKSDKELPDVPVLMADSLATCCPRYRARFGRDPEVIYTVPWFNGKVYYMPAPEVKHD